MLRSVFCPSLRPRNDARCVRRCLGEDAWDIANMRLLAIILSRSRLARCYRPVTGGTDAVDSTITVLAMKK